MLLHFLLMNDSSSFLWYSFSFPRRRTEIFQFPNWRSSPVLYSQAQKGKVRPEGRRWSQEEKSRTCMRALSSLHYVNSSVKLSADSGQDSWALKCRKQVQGSWTPSAGPSGTLTESKPAWISSGRTIWATGTDAPVPRAGRAKLAESHDSAMLYSAGCIPQHN